MGFNYFYTKSIPVTMAASGNDVSKHEFSVAILLQLFLLLLLLVPKFTSLLAILYSFTHPFGTCVWGFFIVG